MADTLPGKPRSKKKSEDVPYPDHLLIESQYKSEVKRIKVDRWFKQEYHDQEVEKIWKKAWQVACRVEEIPDVGDYIIYDIAELSFIVMRSSETEIKAFWNSCPHRARKLREYEGKGVPEIRCMFHGWAWNVDGSNKTVMCGWDFPGTSGEVDLVQAKVGVWGGFVFINPDPDCEPLEDYLGTLPDHFEGAGHDMSKRWKQVHVAAVIDANWKVAQEAFIEAWHVPMTHPQLVWGKGTQRAPGVRWDDFGNWMRSAIRMPHDKQPEKPNWILQIDDEQAAVDSYYDRHLNEEPPIVVHPGEQSSQVIVDQTREYFRSVIGDEIDKYHDIDLSGGDMVSVFPNFHPWGAFSRITYRFRPYKSDPNRSIMDVMLMSPWPEGKEPPPPAKVHWLKPGEDTSAAPELGQLARIFLQDINNMPRVQEGLKTSGRQYVILSEHNEAPMRHLHDLYEKWMGLDDGQ